MARDWHFFAIVVVWFASSVATEVADSVIMQNIGAPLTLALWKFIVSIPCGIAAIYGAGQTLPSCSLSESILIAKTTLPLALMIVMAKIFTYVSYGYVPLSTAQVAKAAMPVATLLMARAFLGERFSFQSYLALVPIVLGVWLGVSVGMSDFNVVGVLAALASCLMAAGQSVYMKTIFSRQRNATAPSLSPLTLNFLVACGCVAQLLPIWLGVQLGLLPVKLDGGKLFIFHIHRRRVQGNGIVLSFVFGGISQYVQSACAYLVINMVSPATSAVIGTARKPFIVVVSLVLFASRVSLINVIGIVFTFGGTFWYTLVTEEERAGKRDVSASGEQTAMTVLGSG